MSQPAITFLAMCVQETAPDQFARSIISMSLDDLPHNDVLVRVCYSSLNYKDALSALGNRGVTRRYPHTPGIDAVGVVEDSATSAFHPGDPVLIGSADFGANAPGGFSQYARVPAAWLMPLPAGLTMHESMMVGTAGITAALCVLRLQDHGVKPEDGDVLVTGATGGVGCISVAILSKLGYRAIAATGKADAQPMLRNLGAADVISRDEVNDVSGKALLKGCWAGVIDTVGGNILATALKTARYGAVITCCGNVAGPEFSTTVYPFILRAVSLVGIDIANCPADLRKRLWRKLAGDWRPGNLSSVMSDCSLHELNQAIDRMLAGRLSGRVVVNLQ